MSQRRPTRRNGASTPLSSLGFILGSTILCALACSPTKESPAESPTPPGESADLSPTTSRDAEDEPSPDPASSSAVELPTVPTETAVPLRLALVADLHVRNIDGVVSADTGSLALLDGIRAQRPSAIVLLGDMTSGNRWHPQSAAELDRTWAVVTGLVAPLRDDGIAIVPVLGNHDCALPEQCEAYARAWQDLAHWVAPFTLQAIPGDEPPFHYALRHADNRLLILDNANDGAEARQRDFAAAAFGLDASTPTVVLLHKPIVSVLWTTRRWADALAPALVDAPVVALFAGHEHLFWDCAVALDEAHPLRQVTCGLACDGRRFPILPEPRRAHCSGKRCRFESSRTEIAFDPRSGKQKSRHSWVLAEIEEGAVEIELKGGW